MLDAEWLSELRMHCRDEVTFARILDILEIEPEPEALRDILTEAHTPKRLTSTANPSGWGDFHAFVRALERIRHSLNLDDILQATADEARAYLNLDRVAIVQLTPELHGQFLVESRRDNNWPSLLHDFPHRSAAERSESSESSPKSENSENSENSESSQKPENSEERDAATEANDRSEKYTIELMNADVFDGLGTSDQPEQRPHLEATFLAYLEPWGIRSISLVPIFCDNVTWGILIAARLEDSVFGVRTREILQQFGWTVGNALDHADLLEQTRSQTRKLATTLRALQQTQAQLIQNEKMASLGQLVAGIAHELNNPVNFIYGNVSYIRDYTEDLLDTIDGYQAQFVGSIDPLTQQLDELEFDFIRQDLPRLVTSMHNGITRIRKIVSSLRTFSRLDEAEIKTVDIHSGIDSALLLLRHRCRATECTEEVMVECHYGDLPPISCYPASLNQVFVNILTNAFDALAQTSERIPKISIATTCLEGDRIAIAFRDNGCGIASEHRDRIFDPFFTTKPPGRGTGLGLSIGYQIVVETHDGQLYCESEPDQGSTFTIELPIDGAF